MDWKEVGGKIAKAAPLIGGILGGPLGGAAGSVISMVAGALGLKPEETTPDRVNQIIEADPQALVSLRTAEMKHEEILIGLKVETEKAHLKDRQSAREREMEVVKATGKKDYNLYFLAWTVVMGFFALCGVLMKVDIPTGTNQVVIMLFGALATGFGTVLSYFFGSSKSSKEKTELLAKK
jgi:uncharacterized protein YcfJ